MKYRVAIYIAIMGLLILFGSVYYYGSSKAFSDRFKSTVERELSSATGMNVSVSSVSFTPLPFMLEVKGVILKDKKTREYIMGISNIKIYLRVIPLINKKIHARLIELSGIRLSPRGGPILMGLMYSSGSKSDKFRVQRIVVKNSYIKYEKENLVLNIYISRMGYFVKTSELHVRGMINSLKYKGVFMDKMKIDGVLNVFKDHIRLKRMIFNKKDISLVFKGNIITDNTLALKLSLKARMPAEKIFSTIGISLPIFGVVSVKGALHGPINAPVLNGSLQIRKGEIYGILVDTANAELRVSPELLKISSINAKAYNGTIVGGFYLKFPFKGFTLAIKGLSLDSEPVKTLAHMKDLKIPQGKVDLILFQSGTKFNPRGYFLFRSDTGAKAPWEDIRKAGAFFWYRGGIVFIQGINVKWSHGSLYSARGWISIEGKKIYLKGKSFINDFKRLGVDIKGIFRGDVTIEGPISTERVFLDGTIEDIEVHGVSLGNMDIKGCISGRCLVLKPAMQQGLTVQGVFRKDLIHLIATAEDISIDRLFSDLKDIRGRLSGNLVIDGAPGSLHGKGIFSINNLFYKTLFIGDAQMTTLFTDKGFDIRDFVINNGSSLIRGGFSYKKGIVHTEKIEFNITPKDFGVLKVLPLRFKGDLQGTGPLKAIVMNLTSDMFVSNEKIGQARIDATSNRVSFNISALQGNIELTAVLNLTRGYPWKMELDMKETDYRALLKIFYPVPEDFSLITRGHISVQGNKEDIAARGTFETLSIGFRGKQLQSEGPITFKYDGRWVHFGALRLTSEGADITVMTDLNLIDTDGRISVFGDFDMPFLNGLFSGINFSSGSAVFSFSLNGPWEGSNLYGGINFKDVEVIFEDFDEGIRIRAGQIYIEHGHFYIKEIVGDAMDGQFKIKGEGLLKGLRPVDFNITSEIKAFLYRPDPEIEIRFDGQVYLTETVEGPYLGGRIFVIDGLISKDITLKGLLSLRQNKAPRKAGPFSNIRLNISIDIPETVKIENNILEAKVKGSMTVTGRVSSVGLIGNIEFKDGFLYFRNNRFSIVHAVVEFTNPEFIRPYIDFSGSTEIRQYTITANVNGYPEDLRITFYSDPYLDRADILSLLTFGTMAEGTRGLEGEIGASEAALFLTGELQKNLNERLKTLTGIDRIDIEPYIEDSGAIGPKITFYKRLLSDRLSIVYSTTTSEQTKDTVEVLFKLSDRVSISGQRDEKGFLGGDIRFRLRFR